MFKLYCASPISGMKVEDVIKYYSSIVRQFPKAKTLHPMMGKGSLRTDLEFKSHGYEGDPLTSNHAILQRDTWMVSQADIVFLNLENATDRVSIGCCMELAMAYHMRKYTVVVLPKDNIHNHAFVLEAADAIFENSEDAIGYINKLIDSTEGRLKL